MKIARRTGTHPDSGSILVLALLLLLALGGLTATLSVLNVRLHKEHERARDDLRAFSAAEAGLNEAYSVLLESSFAGVDAIAYPRTIGTGSYRVQMVDGRDDHAVDVDHVRLRSVGDAGRDPAGAQLMVLHTPTGKFEFAIFGAQGVRMSSNTTVDSYDPTDGPYPDKVDFVNDFGNVGSFEKIEIHSNVDIHGDALVDEDGVFDDSAPGITVSGDQVAGELHVEMPLITVPTYPSSGILLVAGATTLPPGNYHYSSLSVSKGTLTVQGPATLVVDNLSILNTLAIDSTNGPVKLYCTGNIKMGSNTKVTTSSGKATDLEVQITTNNITGGKTIELNTNSEFTGTIYAPNARIRIPSNFQLYGAVKAAYIEMASNSHIHFDENLLYDPNAEDIFQLVSWRRLSRDEIREVEAGGALP